MRAKLLFLLIACSAAAAQSTNNVNLAASGVLTLRQVKAETVIYKNWKAVRITDAAPSNFGDTGRLAIVNGTAFTNGAIDLDVSGDTAPNADPAFRGFVGLAFRLTGSDPTHFECFYLRPKNGRSADAVQRGHSTQYISMPGYPWQKLRSETPGKYESYVDLVPGEWTHMRVVVSGQTAKLYVNNAPNPTLVVNDLKQPVASGALALWIGPGTIAHFANLSFTASETGNR